ncbi:RagB/SusD family nutrient uptake outer membrane protein [Rufibacter glacialis]|uniref:RagB/SusD family nutrient uptake outer membrane protein n=1 Tax=Rufibacter glacialis TaxID=1259555 RepID=A0A5M8QHL3_9BACT|nr:RagB/SusD family nutrient uptake outer membrane protein [Rufibacter glacialis]KAA6435525.1 RagB/SusD family nutrient uptake outer membrane protein [Rufibacter glacialis]GGK64243.1 membrane protein [Rufibacter glacialis]
MKNIGKKTSSFLLLGLLLAATPSCDNFLENNPLDTRTEDNFYKTQADATEALIGVYDVLQWNTLSGFHPTPMVTDILSDDAYSAGQPSSEPSLLQMDRHQILTTNGEVYGLWRKHYIGISRANTLLQRIGGIDAPDDFKKRVIAEAKFLRAHFYLDLVRLFENVPLILAPQTPSEYNQPQATPKAVYDQIALDLTEAMPDLPASNLRASTGRATRWAAKAQLAKAYLFYKGVYNQELQAGSTTVNAQVALQHVNDIISTSGHTLLPNYADNFTRANEYSIEAVWEISYSDENPWFDWGYVQGGEGNMQPQQQGPRIKNTATEKYLAGWSTATPTQELYEAFTANDPRRDATILAETELAGGKANLNIGYQHTGYFSQKYTTAKEYAPSGGQLELNWGNNYRAIRFSDVLLMASELMVMTGTGDAQAPLTRVRARVGLPPIPATLDNIYRERRLELALEGHRYWDLLRRGTSAAAAAITVNRTTLPSTYEGVLSDFNLQFNAARKGFLPIPQSEIDLSAGVLKPNAGY